MTVPSPDQLLAAHEDASVGMAVVQAHGPELGRYLRVNRALCEMLGYSEEELLQTTVQAVSHPDDLELGLAQFRALAAGQIGAYDLEKRLLHADGRPVWVRVHVSLVRAGDGSPLFTVWQIVDISALKRVVDRLAAVIDTSLDAIVTADANGTILEFNPAAERLFGYRERDAVGASIDLIVPDERREALRRLFAGEDQHLLGRRLEMDARHADGNFFPVELSIMSIEGHPPFFIGFIRDLRETRGALTALLESEERYRRIVEATSEGIWVIDADALVSFVNRRGAAMLGYEPEHVLGHSPVDFVEPSERERGLQMVGQLREGREADFSIAVCHRDGHTVHLRVSAAPLLDDDGAFAGSLGMVADITERLREERERAELEVRLSQAQRLETVGQLAGGVAHDFNNLLSVIQGYADYVTQEVADRPDALEAINEIRRAAERAAGLTRQLLTFSRRDMASPEVVDLGEVVAEVRSLLGRTLGKEVELTLELSDEPARVSIDVHRFEQVLLNLAVNARDAMPDGGRLSIGLCRRDDGWVELAVADTGIGMPTEVIERAFEPFFTTKPAGEGTGLGLATVYGIVTQAGGAVKLESVGKGTRALVELPEAPPGVGVPVGPSALDAPDADGQTILLVEDEASVRAMAARILRRHGYEVVEASGAEDALTAFRTLERRPDLVLTDVAMPRMSGVELAARLGKTAPPVVFMSGYTDDSVGNPEVLARSAGFLQKPFSAAALLHCVGAALAAD